MKRVAMNRWCWTGGSVVAITVLLTGFVAWRASRALNLSRQELQTDHEIAFTLRPFSPAQNTGFEIVRSPEVFEQSAYFQNHLYVAGPAGLSSTTRLVTSCDDSRPVSIFPGLRWLRSPWGGSLMRHSKN